MRSTTTHPHHFRRTASRLTATDDDGSGPWTTARVIAESERVVRRLQQLEARPWWRVSGRELDELDARLDVLRSHAADAVRG